MMICIISGTEDGSAHPNHSTAAGNGIDIIAGHSHRQNLDRYIIVFFCPYVNSKVANFLKKFIVITGIFANGRNCHQSTDPNVGKCTDFLQNGGQLLLEKAGLALLAGDVDLQ